MNITLVNGWYLATNARAGGWSGTPSTEQLSNANIIRSFFLNEGWTINAICGMLGCMQGESTVNPAFIQDSRRSVLPNSANNLSDVPNSIMKNFFKEYYQDTRRRYGIGLVQWDGYSNVPLSGGGTEQQQKMVAFAIANNIVWYDGWTQLYRIRSEQEYDASHQDNIFFQTRTVHGVQYNFDNYPYSTTTPEILAEAWTRGYEINEGGVGYRAENARHYYDYFTSPDAPDIILPEDFLLPLEADPEEPPFDPLHPVDPLVPGKDELPAWLYFMAIKRRKEYVRCLQI